MTFLSLDFNHIGDVGAAALAKAIESPNSKLTRLNLQANQIGDAGAAALARALESPNSDIIGLELGSNRISDVGVTELAKSIESAGAVIEMLHLSTNQIGDAGAAALARAVGNSRTVTWLNLGSNNIGDAGVAALSKAVGSKTSQISWLALSNNKIGDAGAAELAKCVDLPTSKLTKLDVDRNRIGDAGGRALAQAIATPHCKLTGLDLRDNKIGDAGASAIAVASVSSNITGIDLSSNQLGDIGAEAFSTAIRNSRSSLKELRLWGNRISGAAMAAVTVSLKIARSLDSETRKLDFEGTDVGDDEAVELSEAIKSRGGTLRTINLGHNRIGDRGVAALAQAFEVLNVTTLDLRHNDIGDVGAAALARAIESVNCTITKLWLGHNRIGNDGAIAIARAVGTLTSSLTKLTLNHNDGIGNPSALEFARVMSDPNCKLTLLDVNSNSIDEEGAGVLTSAVERADAKVSALRMWGQTFNSKPANQRIGADADGQQGDASKSGSDEGPHTRGEEHEPHAGSASTVTEIPSTESSRNDEAGLKKRASLPACNERGALSLDTNIDDCDDARTGHAHTGHNPAFKICDDASDEHRCAQRKELSALLAEADVESHVIDALRRERIHDLATLEGATVPLLQGLGIKAGDAIRIVQAIARQRTRSSSFSWFNM